MANDMSNPARTTTTTVIFTVEIDAADPIFTVGLNGVLDLVVSEKQPVGYILERLIATDLDKRVRYLV